MSTSKNKRRTFVYYVRNGDTVTPHQAELVQKSDGWKDGRAINPRLSIKVGAPIDWATLYGGHLQWIEADLDARTARRTRQRPLMAPVPVAA